jgi:hypothetical protein
MLNRKHLQEVQLFVVVLKLEIHFGLFEELVLVYKFVFLNQVQDVQLMPIKVY